MMLLIKTSTSVLKVSLYIITCITARLIKFVVVLVIIAVSTFIHAYWLFTVFNHLLTLLVYHVGFGKDKTFTMSECFTKNIPYVIRQSLLFHSVELVLHSLKHYLNQYLFLFLENSFLQIQLYFLKVPWKSKNSMYIKYISYIQVIQNIFLLNPFICSLILAAPAYGVYISQLI